jgi:hypothetical protein
MKENALRQEVSQKVSPSWLRLCNGKDGREAVYCSATARHMSKTSLGLLLGCLHPLVKFFVSCLEQCYYPEELYTSDHFDQELKSAQLLRSSSTGG